MGQVNTPNRRRVMAAAVLSLLACANAWAVRCYSNPDYPGCGGFGESDEWRVELVHTHREHPYYFLMRATNKLDGSSTSFRIPTPYGELVNVIQVHGSRAVVIGYLTRGLYRRERSC